MRALDPISTMPESVADTSARRLTLRGRLEDLARVWPWVETLAATYAIPAALLFSVNLCLEEALSNIVRHGYGGGSALPITIDFAETGSDGIAFVIEDRAGPFDPLEFSCRQEAPPPASIEDFEPGGQGIRLLRKFSGSLSYERLSGGNRLTIGFRKISPE